MSEAKIAIMLKNGKIAIKSQLRGMSQAEIALLITHLELLRDELKSNFKKSIRRLEDNQNE